MKKLFSVIIIGLLCLSIFSMISPKAKAAENTELVSLPGGCKYPDPSNTALDTTRLLISISIKGQGQTATVSPGETVSATCTYQIYSGAGNPNEINQGFFILSWTPTWPPPSGYYIPIWNGISGVYPGVTNTASFTFTAPSTSGTYYLYWCGGAEYTMDDAVSKYNQPLVSPAHAKIIVGSAPTTGTLTLTVFDESGFAPASANGFQRLAEVKVKIYDAGGSLVASGQSGNDGTVTFNLDPGAYTVQYGGSLYRYTTTPQSTDLTTYGACLPDSKQVTVTQGINQLNLYVAGLLFHVYQSGSDGGDPFQLDYVDLNSTTADHETTITVSPGQTVHAVASFWELETINVPVWWASVFGDWNPTATLANLASGVASPSSHTLHTVPFTFTAPTQPGTYHIRLNGALDYDWCNSYYTGMHPNPNLGRDMGNSIISNINIGTQTRNITGTYGIGTIIVSGGKHLFSPTTDGYQFSNTIPKETVSFESAYAAIASALWVPSTTDRFTLSFLAWLSLIVQNQLNFGNCFGMSYTAKYYYENPSAFSAKYPGYQNLHALSMATASPEIIANQFPGQEVMSPFLYNAILTYFGLKSLNDDMQWLMNQIDNYHVVQLYVFNPVFLHSVLVYDYVLSPNALTLKVYNPNEQDTTDYIYLVKDQNGNFALHNTGSTDDLVNMYHLTDVGCGEHNSVDWSIIHNLEHDARVLDFIWNLAKSTGQYFLGLMGKSPINILVTDPNGMQVGYDSTRRLIVDDIDGAFYSGNGTEPQVVMIPDSINGSYNIKLHGTGSGSYNLTTELTTFSGTTTKTYLGHISTGEIQTLVADVSGANVTLHTPSPTFPWVWLIITIAIIAVIVGFSFAWTRRPKRMK